MPARILLSTSRRSASTLRRKSQSTARISPTGPIARRTGIQRRRRRRCIRWSRPRSPSAAMSSSTTRRRRRRRPRSRSARPRSPTRCASRCGGERAGAAAAQAAADRAAHAPGGRQEMGGSHARRSRGAQRLARVSRRGSPQTSITPPCSSPRSRISPSRRSARWTMAPFPESAPALAAADRGARKAQLATEIDVELARQIRDVQHPLKRELLELQVRRARSAKPEGERTRGSQGARRGVRAQRASRAAAAARRQAQGGDRRSRRGRRSLPGSPRRSPDPDAPGTARRLGPRLSSLSRRRAAQRRRRRWHFVERHDPGALQGLGRDLAERGHGSGLRRDPRQLVSRADLGALSRRLDVLGNRARRRTGREPDAVSRRHDKQAVRRARHLDFRRDGDRRRRRGRGELAHQRALAAWTQFTTPGGTFLFIVNGADAPRTFDGTSWATPSITGITASQAVHVNAHKRGSG
jgi:hypothetical protein